MNKRMDKKKQKKNAAAVEAGKHSPMDSRSVHFYIQYQEQEYLEKVIVERVLEQCSAEGASLEEMKNVSIYLKPEDKKAYFTYGTDKSGAIDL